MGAGGRDLARSPLVHPAITAQTKRALHHAISPVVSIVGPAANSRSSGHERCPNRTGDIAPVTPWPVRESPGVAWIGVMLRVATPRNIMVKPCNVLGNVVSQRAHWVPGPAFRNDGLAGYRVLYSDHVLFDTAPR